MLNGTNLTTMFETACWWVGTRPFLIDDLRGLSGTEAAASVRQAAARLRAAGLRKGGVVAFLSGASVDHAVAFFAVLRAGGAACFLHLRESDGRLADTLADIGPSILVVEDGAAERAAAIAANLEHSPPILTLARLSRFEQGDDEVAEADVAADDLAAIILSSGTTGRPKQVLHTHRTLHATAMMAAPIYGVEGPHDGIVIPMAPSFGAWMHTVLPFVAQRGTITFQRKFDAAGYVDLLEQQGGSVAALVPTVWRMILPSLAKRELPRLRVAMFSGEPGTPDLVNALNGRFSCLRSVYLASEGGCASGVVADEHLLARDGMSAAAGQPVPGADVRVIDPDSSEFRAVAEGEIGEIAVRGPSVSIGYLGQPELTAQRFSGGWWRTGDHGWIDSYRVVHIKGRADNRINTGGIKVHAEEIESALLRLPIVRAAAVVGVPDPHWGERIEAHVVLADPALGAEAVAAALETSGSLPRMMLPKRFHVHESLPSGPTGKLYRRALLEGPAGVPR